MEDGCKVEIVSEHGAPMPRGPGHDFRIGSVRRADHAPMSRLDTDIRKNPHPCRAEIHVDHKSHRSNGLQGDLPFFRPPSGVGKGGSDILDGEIGIEFEDFGDFRP